MKPDIVKAKNWDGVYSSEVDNLMGAVQKKLDMDFLMTFDLISRKYGIKKADDFRKAMDDFSGRQFDTIARGE